MLCVVAPGTGGFISISISKCGTPTFSLITKQLLQWLNSKFNHSSLKYIC